MVKGIIFDLDGTLLNTIGDICHVLNECLESFCFNKISVEQCTKLVGNGAKSLVERAVGGEAWEQVYKLYEKKFNESDSLFTTLYKDEEEVLNILQRRGLKFAVVTNKPQRATENVCNKLLYKFGFSVYLGQSGKYPLKPDPAATIKAMEIMGLKSDECIFVGDGETDVQTAKNAGLKSVSVLWGYRTQSQLEAAGATHFAEKFSDLLNFV